MMTDSIKTKENAKILHDNYGSGTVNDFLYCVRLMVENFLFRFKPARYIENMSKLMTDAELKKYIKEFDDEQMSYTGYVDEMLTSEREIVWLYYDACKIQKTDPKQISIDS